MQCCVRQRTSVLLWAQIVPHRVAARLLADQGLMKLLLNIATWILDPQGAGTFTARPPPRSATLTANNRHSCVSGKVS